MASFQDVLDAVAKVVGGNQPDATNRPRWFSGDQMNGGAGDGSGLQAPFGPTFKGCYSAPPEAIEDIPVGIVLPGPFRVEGPAQPDVYVQGEEYNVDDLRVVILMSRGDAETDQTNLAPYRDLMPAAFAAHMGAFATTNVLQAMVRGGKPIVNKWAGTDYAGWEFTVRVIRIIARTYAA